MRGRTALSRKSLNLIGRFSVVNGNKVDFQWAAATVGLPLAIRVTRRVPFINQNQLTATADMYVYSSVQESVTSTAGFSKECLVSWTCVGII